MKECIEKFPLIREIFQDMHHAGAAHYFISAVNGTMPVARQGQTPGHKKSPIRGFFYGLALLR